MLSGLNNNSWFIMVLGVRTSGRAWAMVLLLHTVRICRGRNSLMHSASRWLGWEVQEVFTSILPSPLVGFPTRPRVSQFLTQESRAADLIRPSHGLYTCHFGHVLLLRANHRVSPDSRGGKQTPPLEGRSGREFAAISNPSRRHSWTWIQYLPRAGCVILDELCALSKPR